MTGRREHETNAEQTIRNWLVESAPVRAPSSLRETLESVTAQPPGDARPDSRPTGRGRTLLRLAAAAVVLAIVGSSIYLYSRSERAPAGPVASQAASATATLTPTLPGVTGSAWHVVVEGLPSMEGEGGSVAFFARPSGGFVTFITRWIPPDTAGGQAGAAPGAADPTWQVGSTYGSEVLTSAEGLAWVRQSLLRGFVTGLAYAGDKAVAVGCSEYGNDETNSYAAWTTADFKTWKAARLPGRADGFSCVTGVAAGPDGLLAWSRSIANSEAPLGFRFWRSSDGTSWQPLAAAGLPAAAAFEDVAGVPDGYVITGLLRDRAATWHSPDGETWTQVWTGPGPSGTETYTLGPVFEAAGGGYVSLGAASLTLGEAANHPGDRLTWTSADRIHWTLAQSSTAPGWIRAIDRGPRGYVAAGPSLDPTTSPPGPPAVWTSVDGRTWQPVILPEVAATLSAWGIRVVSDGNHVVVVCVNDSLVFLLVE